MYTTIAHRLFLAPVRHYRVIGRDPVELLAASLLTACAGVTEA